ncbi:hypothetical protein JR064_22335 [Xanthomonas sp. CFBP 8703]|uniref:TerB N-terminal domain-containing protein n=1 Tax=Xanthomonas bonasiae TaxID=2810351 RepID=A0ABS3B9K9_9XANT|nr:hypothetical protein [Xanthomonas bonasiae]MBN6104906.1 hypothetical protein [Xanthomonas bonasiae]
MKPAEKEATATPEWSNVGYRPGPKTHFFYEYEGEQAVDPAALVGDGILLWHEQVYDNELHDLAPLWAFAGKLLDADQDAPMYSYLEWLRFQVVIGGITPDEWKEVEPYPYKGMLISAIYFQMARKLCSEGDTGRVWHLIALAYYNLGLHTVPSASRVFASYAASRHAEYSKHKRAIVLEVIKRLPDDGSISSIAKAKSAVIDYIQAHPTLLSEFEKLDRLVPTESKHNIDNDAMDRLERTLGEWAGPRGPYPEMTTAFARFSAKKAEPEVSAATPRVTTEEFVFEEASYHTRILNSLASGDILSMHFSHEPEN